MRRRSTADPERAKSRRRKTIAQKRRGLRNPSAADHKTQSDVAQLTRERDEALEREKAKAIENTRLFAGGRGRTPELQEALDYQTATSDVLEVISRTPIDLQPVLAATCETVAKLCETKDAEIFIRDGDRLRLGWVQGPIGTEAENWPITRGLVMGRAVLNRELIQVHDLRAAGEEYPEGYQSSLVSRAPNDYRRPTDAEGRSRRRAHTAT